MQSLENKDFENAWRKAFSEAEDEPSAALWTNLENKLAAAEGTVMRSRMVFYQRLAAASIIIAFALAGIVLVDMNFNPDKKINSFKTPGKTNSEDAKIKVDKSYGTKDKNKVAFDNRIEEDVTNKDHNEISNSTNNSSNQILTEKTLRENKLTSKSKGNGIAISSETNSRNNVDQFSSSNTIKKDERSILTQINRLPEYSITLTNNFALYDLKIKGEPILNSLIPEHSTLNMPTLLVRKKVKENENWWAALSGSAGAYIPSLNSGGASYSNYNTPVNGSSSQLSGTSGAIGTSNSKVGTSFSVGMTVGKKITNRWVVITGITYLTQSIQYASNQSVNGNQAFLADLTNQKGYNSNLTSTYNLNSINEFISIPFLVGYQISQRKLGLQLNAGIAPDIFIRNSLVDPTGKLATYSETAGENSAYKNLNITGLLGTELSYKISANYRVSLVPGIRYSFQSIVKPSVGSTITPIVWDIGFRFCYTLK